MTLHHNLQQLNPAQLKAATSSEKNVLVLAGAGSGKTRVLTHRIIHLIQQGIPLHHILSVTFTNKAAAEMRKRVEHMLGIAISGMWLGTFHSLMHRFLRIHWQEANLHQDFQIIDAEDQYRLIRRIHKEINLDEESWPVKQSLAFINRNKENALRANQLNSTSGVDKILIRIYQTYEDTCQRSNLVDFSELLLRPYELLSRDANLLAHYQQRFSQILVDEFQDTNSIQYGLIRLLAGSKAHIMAVGDDDQSIYSWRGANVENMQHLLHDFPNTEVIRLEQNYRSTPNILQAANAVISYNKNRMGKNLWTDGKSGELITIYAAFNEIDEAKFIADKIKNLYPKDENNLCNFAILYRSNAQSRVLEEQLIHAQIPYRIYGGVKFFERAEIKDALAYVRLTTNHFDDPSLERILNVPTRGIGDTTLLLLRDYAKQQNMPIFIAIQDMLSKQALPTRAATALQNFVSLINNFSSQMTKLEPHDFVDYVIKTSGLHAHFAKDKKNERNLNRVENLEELVNATKQFALANEWESGKDLLSAFLANAALEAGDTDEGKNTTNCVQLMTLHAAKGLEFPVVFLCGMEEGLFPHLMSMESEAEIEEERRLCYVGITRAMRKLYCVYADSRQLYGVSSFRRPSRFLKEIPKELTEEENIVTSARPTYFSTHKHAAISRSSGVDFSAKTQSSVNGFSIGQRVKHQKFGEGTIISFEGQGEHFLVQIKFARYGTKWLSPLYAQLAPI